MTASAESLGTEAELRALRQVRFAWAATPDDVWQAATPHVNGVQAQAEDALRRGMDEAWRSAAPSPIGLALQGQKGVGKTHLLGWIRDRVHRGGGYFFLLQLLDGKNFWRSAVHGILDGLLRPVEGHGLQASWLLGQLAAKTAAPLPLEAVLRGEAAPSREQLDAFVEGLWRLDRQVGLESRDTARALVLYAAPEMQAQEVGRGFLSLDTELDPEDASAWGFQEVRRSPQLVLRDLSRLMALTDGPTVIAVDQLDTLFAQSRRATTDNPTGDPSDDPALDPLINQVADGLMRLREETRRTLTVVTCLPNTWTLIRDRAADTVPDRFTERVLASTLSSPEVARRLVATRLTARDAEVGFTPPYPTWPVRPEAFEQATQFSARALLQRVDKHVRHCLELGESRELSSLATEVPVPPPPPKPAEDALARLDEEFDRRRAGIDVAAVLDPDTEDVVFPRLLLAAFTCLREELGEAGEALEIDPAPGTQPPPLHARLRLVLDPETEDEVHWAFRAVLATHHRRVQARLSNARVAAGLERDVDKRQLVLLRNTPWPTGRRTTELVTAFRDDGGIERSVAKEDLQTLVAIQDMLAVPPPDLRAWLRSRQPVARTELFQAVLSDVLALDGAAAAVPERSGGTGDVVPERPGASGEAEPGRPAATGEAVLERPGVGSAAVSPAGSEEPGTSPSVPPVPSSAAPSAPSGSESTLPLGVTLADGRPFAVSVESLRRHAVVFAGSGSGKTVLLRRIIEECALRGVSSIVLDPNNDLARLGDPWPEPPEHWGPGDRERAADYLAGTDVVVWTPGRRAGRPLVFRPLPDFEPVLSDEDEFRDAVDAAVDSLATRAESAWSRKTAEQGRAVLRGAVSYAARAGRATLPELVALLRDLPDGVTSLSKGRALGAAIADALTAAQVNDPLFGGDGTPVDPGLLLRPATGKRARVSVISFVGLPSAEQRQSFVNQLQLALFAWIKANPASDRPLGGLLVLDEAPIYAPSRGTTAASRSTVVLAAQARKYGLGLLFATQAPKDLDNRIPGNAILQLFGALNSPTQIAAARELARAKGGDVTDFARLSTGRFYAAAEGRAFTKVATPQCLSHHPKSPLTPEEVIARAATTPAAPGAATAGAVTAGSAAAGAADVAAAAPDVTEQRP